MTQRQALSVMLSGAPVFLTGAPGAGKTYVLNEFVRRAKKTGRNVAVTASTGIAATHIGGTTIHSWSGLGVRDHLSEWDKERLSATDKLVKRYNVADVLVIDEVSMLHGHRLDMVNEVCKLLRQNDEPFGGLQVVLVGDLFQLPPVTRSASLTASRGGELLDFVHTSAAWEELQPRICYLSEQHRQANDGLLELLEAMRSGEVGEEHEARLRERLGKRPSAELVVTRLYAHNVDVETINQRHLQGLAGESKAYSMTTKGAAAKVEQLVKSVLAPETLELKTGAEVMFVANNFAEGFVNGSRGQVVDFKNDLPLVKLTNGREIKVEPHSWTLTEDGRTRAEVVQLPLRLAWAITIHKSQGMSLDAAEIDLSRTFTPGMGYVALSRVRSLEGVYLSGLNRMALQMHEDMYEFDEALRRASTIVAASTGEIDDESPDETEELAAYDEQLFAKLKQWRTQRAEAEHLPAYIIAHNTMLEAIAARPPRTRPALMGIKGFGAKKIEAYGDEILKIVNDYFRKPELLSTDGREKSSPTAKGRLNSGPMRKSGSPENAQHFLGPSTAGLSHLAWDKADDHKLLELFHDGTPLAQAAVILKRSHGELWQRLSELHAL